MVQSRRFEVRGATIADVDEIAAAHLDSIHSLGAAYYPADVVRDWAALVRRELYVNAMAAGEVFHVAVGERGEGAAVLGFSSHRIDDDHHGVAVYVRGKAGRQGVGSALLRAAEASALAAGASRIDIDASLAALEFYKVHGFEELGRGEHRLDSGRTMDCVFMRKTGLRRG